MKPFNWEQQEHQRRYEQLHQERESRLYLVGEVRRIASVINEHDPVTAGELLDAIEDHQALKRKHPA